jgi:hypothetical protein
VGITKVDAVKRGGNAFTLFEGNQQVRLDSNTTTRIASAMVDDGIYSEIRIQLDDEATIEETDNTSHKATVETKQITATLDKSILRDETSHIIVDIKLTNAVTSQETPTAITYSFEPKPFVIAKIVRVRGISTITELGPITPEEEDSLNIQHIPAIIKIVSS